jgi:RNA polymerase sigma factor (sigma-70 family)
MFPTTRRSMVAALASGDAEERTRAFDTLVAVYWRPVYKYLRVRVARTREDAEDRTQSFFARAFEKDSLAGYDPARASFRTFLRLLLDRHASNESKSEGRLKRGGGATHLDFDEAEGEIDRDAVSASAAPPETPEEYFHREWVRSAFALAVDRLRSACGSSGRESNFALFQAYDLDGEKVSYRDLGTRLGLSETIVTNRLASVRRQFREIVLATLAEITATESEFRAEARALLGVEK